MIHPVLANNINPYPRYICASAQMPTQSRNYCVFDKDETDYFVKQKENALPYLTDILKHSNNEGQVTETLYILNRMLDDGTKGIDKLYRYFPDSTIQSPPIFKPILRGFTAKFRFPMHSDRFAKCLYKILYMMIIRVNFLTRMKKSAGQF